MNNIEYEATFYPVDRDSVQNTLRDIGGVLTKEDFLQKRVCYDTSKKALWDRSFLRVRDEGDRITMAIKGSVKDESSSEIASQKEVEVTVDSFENAEEFLVQLGYRKKSYQETRREIWHVDDIEVVIDEWPWIKPLVEIEGGSEKEVRLVAEKLGFVWSDAIFDNVTEIYRREYDVDSTTVNEYPRILFEELNPFV